MPATAEWGWSPAFPEPATLEEATARVKTLGAEMHAIQEQLNIQTQGLGVAKGHVIGEAWAWRSRARHAKLARMHRLASLKRWIAAHPAPRPPTLAELPDAEIRRSLRYTRGLLHRVLEEHSLSPMLRAEIEAVLSASPGSGPDDASAGH